LGVVPLWLSVLYLVFRVLGIRFPLGRKERWADLTKTQSMLCLLSLVGSLPAWDVASDWLYSKIVDPLQPAFSLSGLVGSVFMAVILGCFGFWEIEKVRMKYHP
jgi:hypothetical protein